MIEMIEMQFVAWDSLPWKLGGRFQSFPCDSIDNREVAILIHNNEDLEIIQSFLSNYGKRIIREGTFKEISKFTSSEYVIRISFGAGYCGWGRDLDNYIHTYNIMTAAELCSSIICWEPESAQSIENLLFGYY